MAKPARPDATAPVPEGNLPGHHPEVEQDKPSRPPRTPVVAGGRTATPAAPAPPRQQAFPFAFDRLLGLAARPFGVTPARAWARIDGDELDLRYGPWHIRTPLANVAGAERSGPYSKAKVGGPARVSLSDRGVTFATNAEAGVCISFREPVPAAEPLGLVRHPGATVTVADPEGFVEALRARHVVDG